jgi:hypothetical protein
MFRCGRRASTIIVRCIEKVAWKGKNLASYRRRVAGG